MLTAETSAILARRPDLKLVKVADGAADSWAYLSSDALPSGEEAVDFFHASEHLHAAIATVYGDGTHETQFRHARLRDTLRDEDGGVDKIIRALKHLASKHPRKTSLATEPAYFRKHRKRMRYVELQSTSRRRARRWSRSASSRAERGGASAARKPFSLPSGWDQSDRFDEAWALIAATFEIDVTVLANVIALEPLPTPKKPRAKGSR